MRIKYNRDQKIKGNLTRNFDKDYAFLEKALDRSGDIVKNVFYVGDTADIQSIMEEQTDANTDSDISSATKGQTDANTGNDINSDIGRKTVSKRIVKTTQNNKKINPKKAAVIYWSGTGNTEAMADLVANAAAAAGASVDKFTAAEFNVSSAGDYTGFALGCPAMGAEQLEESEFEPMYQDLRGSLSGKPVGLFLSLIHI